MAIVAIFNQKGGVGKTTTTLNLAACLVHNGEGALAIDLDPQANLTNALGLDINPESSVYRFYKQEKELGELTRTAPNGVHAITSHIELTKVETFHGTGLAAIRRLREGIKAEMLDQCGDTVLLDCCPALGILSFNAIFAAEKVLAPISADFMALQGALQLESTLSSLEQDLNIKIERRYVVTRYDARRKLSKAFMEKARAAFGDKLCSNRINESSALTESPQFQRDVFSHAPHSKGAKDYVFLLDELRSTGFL